RSIREGSTMRRVGGILLLRELFAGVGAEVPPEAADVDVRALAVDSRRAGPGSLFAALPGVNADGADFAAQAIGRGAVAVLASRRLHVSAPVVVASDPRRAFSLAASRFHGEPSRRLSLDAYFGAKAKLFREVLPRGAPAVLNFDDARVAALAAELKPVLGFTLRGAAGAALSAEQIQGDLSGLRFRLRTAAPLDVGLVEVQSPLIGAHNAENLLAAIGVLAGSGVPLREIVRV